MYINEQNESLRKQPFQIVAQKNCSTIIIYLGLLNCLIRFDYNVPVFLLLLFMLLFLNNSQNINSNHLYKYMCGIAICSLIFDLIWGLGFYNQYMYIYPEGLLKEKKYEVLQEMEAWNSQYGLHLMSLIVSGVIVIFKLPYIYYLYLSIQQEK